MAALGQSEVELTYIIQHRLILRLSKIVTIPVKGLLTHWGRVKHMCVSKLAVIGSDRLDGAKPLSEPLLEYC